MVDTIFQVESMVLDPDQVSNTSLQTGREMEDRIWAQLESAFHYIDCIIAMTSEHHD